MRLPRLPSRNVRVFLYGNIAGIAGWWQYVVEHGMDQFALGSLQTFVGALVAAYMMRKDDDPKQPPRKNPIEQHLEARRSSRPRPRRRPPQVSPRGPEAHREQVMGFMKQDGTFDPSGYDDRDGTFDPPLTEPLRYGPPSPAPIPREPRFPSQEAPSEETVALPRMWTPIDEEARS